MAELSLPPIDSKTTECTVLSCDSTWATVETRSINYKDLFVDTIDDKINEALSNMRSKLSAMACVGCGGNIDPRTLVCSCCGRQYRLVAAND